MRKTLGLMSFGFCCFLICGLREAKIFALRLAHDSQAKGEASAAARWSHPFFLANQTTKTGKKRSPPIYVITK